MMFKLFSTDVYYGYQYFNSQNVENFKVNSGDFCRKPVQSRNYIFNEEIAFRMPLSKIPFHSNDIPR